jgi:hypothetical protein
MLKRLSYFIFVITAICCLIIFCFPQSGGALFFEPRSVSLSSGTPLAVASHDFAIQFPSTNNVGSLVFEYCSNTPLPEVPCIPPSGLDVSGASLALQSGNTGFTIDTSASSANKIVLSRPLAPGLLVLSRYNFDNITNPSTPAETVYVRLLSFASNDGSGAYIDKGAATFAVQSVFNVGAFVPPSAIVSI